MYTTEQSYNSKIVCENVDYVYANLSKENEKKIDETVTSLMDKLKMFNDKQLLFKKKNNKIATEKEIEIKYEQSNVLNDLDDEKLKVYQSSHITTYKKNYFNTMRQYNMVTSNNFKCEINFFVKKDSEYDNTFIFEKILNRIDNMYILFGEITCNCNNEPLNKEEYNEVNNERIWEEICDEKQIGKKIGFRIWLYSDPDRVNYNLRSSDYIKNNEFGHYDTTTGVTFHNGTITIVNVTVIEDIMGLLCHELVHAFKLEMGGRTTINDNDVLINELITNTYATLLNAYLTHIEENVELKECIKYELMQSFISFTRLLIIMGLEKYDKNVLEKIDITSNAKSYLISYVVYRTGYMFNFNKIDGIYTKATNLGMFSLKKNCVKYKCASINNLVKIYKNKLGDEYNFFEHSPICGNMEFDSIHMAESVLNTMKSSEFINLVNNILLIDLKSIQVKNEKYDKNNEKYDKNNESMLMLSWALEYLSTKTINSYYGGKYKTKYLKYKHKYINLLKHFN